MINERNGWNGLYFRVNIFLFLIFDDYPLNTEIRREDGARVDHRASYVREKKRFFREGRSLQLVS